MCAYSHNTRVGAQILGEPAVPSRVCVHTHVTRVCAQAYSSGYAVLYGAGASTSKLNQTNY